MPLSVVAMESSTRTLIETATLDQAVLSAVADLEQLEGVEVVQVADNGLASMADIAKRLGRTREGVRILVSGARGPGGFPPQITDPRSQYRLWRWSDVAHWFTERVGEDMEAPQDGLLAAISAGWNFATTGTN